MINALYKTPTPLPIFVFALLFCQASVHANISDQEFLRQQIEQEKLKQRVIPNPNIHIATTQNTPTTNTHHQEQNALGHCFNIHKIQFDTLPKGESLHAFNNALSVFANTDEVFGQIHANALEHKKQDNLSCADINTIHHLVRLAQNRLIDGGFATTRVVVSDQDLSNGTLTLTIIVGKVGEILSNTKDSQVPVYVNHRGLPNTFTNALPIKSGDVLNIRHLETALENFKRVPSTQANFELIPAKSGIIGQSDVLIHYNQDRRLRTSMSLDDAGSESTGKYQYNLTLSVDNPANLNDLLYLSYGHAFDSFSHLKNKVSHQNHRKQHSHNYNLGYVIPIKNAVLNLSYGSHEYAQTVAGIHQDYIYGGKSQNSSLELSYLAHRNAKSKTHLGLGGFHKSQDSHIDGTKIDVQKRKTSGWTAQISHNTAIKDTKINFNLGYQRGTGAFNAIVPPEALFNEGDSRVGIIKLNASIDHPFTKANMNYKGTLKGQYALKALVPSERMSIGGRYSVRGFSGERTLSADDGILLKQDISFKLPSQSKQQGHHLYLGLDAGRVKMKHKEQDDLLLGHTLVGGAIGLKGQLGTANNSHQMFHYDVFASHPINAPKGFFGRNVDGTYKDGEWVYGFSMGVGF